MTTRPFVPFNPVAPLMRAVLSLAGLTREKAMELTGLGEKPFQTLLTPGFNPKQVYVARASCLLGMEPYAWLGLVGEVESAIARKGGGHPPLEELSDLYLRVVALARRHYGTEKVEEQVRRESAKAERQGIRSPIRVRRNWRFYDALDRRVSWPGPATFRLTPDGRVPGPASPEMAAAVAHLENVVVIADQGLQTAAAALEYIGRFCEDYRSVNEPDSD